MKAKDNQRALTQLQELVAKWDAEYRKVCFRLELELAGSFLYLTCKFKRWDVFSIVTHSTWLKPKYLADTLKNINEDLEEKLDWHWYDIWKNCESEY